MVSVPGSSRGEFRLWLSRRGRRPPSVHVFSVGWTTISDHAANTLWISIRGRSSHFFRNEVQPRPTSGGQGRRSNRFMTAPLLAPRDGDQTSSTRREIVACFFIGAMERRQLSQALRVKTSSRSSYSLPRGRPRLRCNFCSISSSHWRNASVPPASIAKRSGRIEARIGLRMMPTFPRSPLSFRTASFPQYGCRVDEDVATLIPHRSGCAGFPLPVLHGRASLAVVKLSPSVTRRSRKSRRWPLVPLLPVQLSVVVSWTGL